MDKRKNKIFLKRAFSLMLSAVVLFTGLPLEMLAAPQSMESKVADEAAFAERFDICPHVR